MAKETPKLHTVETPPAAEISIAKPSAFSLDRFKSKHGGSATGGVDTNYGALPHHSISQAKDFVRLHPDESENWSIELAFVQVPIKGMKRDTLHLIDDDLAVAYISKGKILRFRLALATKPFDVFFLCHVPSTNLDNTWNAGNVRACEQAKSQWVQVTSRKDEGVETYRVDSARDADAFPEPKWPRQALNDLIGATFEGRQIYREDDAALLRLIGKKQSLT